MGDDVKDKLLTNNEECTMNLINLLLTGRATKNLHNGNIIFDGDGKLLVSYLIFMPPKELWEAYSNHTVRPSVRLSRFRVRSISPIFFEVGIPNLVCGCILGWRSVGYHFRVTVTLTSDLVFRIIVSGAYLLYYLR